MSDGAVTDEQPQQIATVRDWDGLIDALRKRAHMLDISREALDELTGLQPGYTAKLLSPVPVRKLGALSFGLLLQALDLELVVVPAGNLSNRVSKRARRVHSGGKNEIVITKTTRSRLRQLGKKGLQIRWANTGESERREFASRISRIRWARVREAERRAEERARAAALSAGAAQDSFSTQMEQTDAR